MQTLPSIDEVAMYMALEGMFGRVGAFGARRLFVDIFDVVDGGLCGICP
jgi:hypothetical protein